MRLALQCHGLSPEEALAILDADADA